ncbi:hypothetical protein PJI16_14725 [Nitrospira sp. MA-1]|nr:hypothetical protein [Nitrospira sp. MA-1]
MKRNLLHDGYGQGQRDLIFLPFVLGALVSVLLFSFQVPYIEATCGTDPAPMNVQQKCRNEKPLLAGSSGTTLIYSFQPWGGVRFVDSERPFIPSRDTYILTLLRGSGPYPLSTAETIPVAAESEMHMTREGRRPTVQLLRSGNPNWMTTF